MDGRKLGVLEFLEAGAAGLRSAYCGARGLVRHPEWQSVTRMSQLPTAGRAAA